jgi:hypothetical protein
VGGTGRAGGERAAESIADPPRVYPYPRAAVRRFVAECVRSAPAERRTCRCVIDDLQTRLPYDEFAAADRAIRRGDPVPERARREFAAATRLCRESA